MGTPCVVSKIRQHLEVVSDDTAMMVEPQSPEAIADGILTLLRDPQRAAMFSQNARMLIKEKFDMEKNVKKLEEVFEVERRVRRQS